MSNFTPGPWSQSHREGSDKMWSTEVYTQDGETICTLGWYPDGHGGTYREANARLIAAAPDLYAAISQYVAHFGDPLKVARAALAKADGKAEGA